MTRSPKEILKDMQDGLAQLDEARALLQEKSTSKGTDVERICKMLDNNLFDVRHNLRALARHVS